MRPRRANFGVLRHRVADGTFERSPRSEAGSTCLDVGVREKPDEAIAICGEKTAFDDICIKTSGDVANSVDSWGGGGGGGRRDRLRGLC